MSETAMRRQMGLMSQMSPISRVVPVSPFGVGPVSSPGDWSIMSTRRATKLSGESGFHMAGYRGSLRFDLYATSSLFVVSVASDVRGRMQEGTGAYRARYRVA